MSVADWPSWPFMIGLGVVAHGPAVLSSGPDIGIGLRCIFAYPEGLLVSMQIRAVDGAGQLLADMLSHPHAGAPRRPHVPHSWLQLTVLDDGEEMPLTGHHSSGTSISAGVTDDGVQTAGYDRDVDAWVTGTPARGVLEVRTGWPEVGAPMTTTHLVMEGLTDLATAVEPLR